ncbi:MAG: tryptophan-rich sensory protein [Verrucomicrobia bacterium]|jgi:tryptophan-rich sensory protein|nr:tryptophan-rich sensory protein [Verrucomicrobiota bacterium]
MQFWKKAILCVFGIELLGNASGLVTFLSVNGWYDALQRPPGTPPDGVFGPVWLTVYAMVGLSLALVWHKPTEVFFKRRALRWFAFQFGLNLLWTPAFFGLQRIDLALVIIVPLLIAIGLTFRAFSPISRPAAGLLVPYLLWVGYATYLNMGFLVLNR